MAGTQQYVEWGIGADGRSAIRRVQRRRGGRGFVGPEGAPLHPNTENTLIRHDERRARETLDTMVVTIMTVSESAGPPLWSFILQTEGLALQILLNGRPYHWIVEEGRHYLPRSSPPNAPQSQVPTEMDTMNRAQRRALRRAERVTEGELNKRQQIVLQRSSAASSSAGPPTSSTTLPLRSNANANANARLPGESTAQHRARIVENVRAAQAAAQVAAQAAPAEEAAALATQRARPQLEASLREVQQRASRSETLIGQLQNFQRRTQAQEDLLQAELQSLPRSQEEYARIVEEYRSEGRTGTTTAAPTSHRSGSSSRSRRSRSGSRNRSRSRSRNSRS